MSTSSINRNNPKSAAPDSDYPSCCSACQAPLCLRKQVINLALGNTDEMLCLNCLGQEGDQPAKAVLSEVKAYVLSRECLAKQWANYPDKSFCPDPKGCFPGSCFADRQGEAG